MLLQRLSPTWRLGSCSQDCIGHTTMTMNTAKAAGAADCSVGITSERAVEIGYREHKPETIKEASTRQMLIRIYANGRYSAQGTSDLRPDPLKRFITESGKILPRRLTGVPAHLHRRITNAIKRARSVLLLR